MHDLEFLNCFQVAFLGMLRLQKLQVSIFYLLKMRVLAIVVEETCCSINRYLFHHALFLRRSFTRAFLGSLLFGSAYLSTKGLLQHIKSILGLYDVRVFCIYNLFILFAGSLIILLYLSLLILHLDDHIKSCIGFLGPLPLLRRYRIKGRI